MKLDPKINSVHDILTPFDTKEATDHIGEYCAFTDDIEDFKDLNLVRYGEFKRVEENRDYPFEYELTVSHLIVTATFCLPLIVSDEEPPIQIVYVAPTRR